MNHLDSFKDFGIVERFEKIGDLFGKAKKSISKGVSGIINKNREDVDLGTEILEHLKKMSTRYNTSGNYNIRNVNKVSNNYYSLVDKVFKNSESDYKIDMMKHIDFKSSSTPEYTVVITKSKGNLSSFSLRTYDGGRKQKNDYNSLPEFDKQNSQRLIIPQKLAKDIYTLAESISKLVTKNVKDDARGL
jgi:hypothetical protein